MTPRIAASLLFVLLLAGNAFAEELECLTTEWKLLGSNHKVCVYAFTDPDIPCVTCYLSQARKGGVAGAVGLAEDPSEFSLDCRLTCQGPPPQNLPKSKKVFTSSTSIFFKDTEITRVFDAKRNTVVYMAISRKIIDGSPKNAVSAVPLK